MTVFDNIINSPKIIYETQSKHNGKIQVVDIGKTRKVKVDGIEQSVSVDSPSCSKLYWGKIIEVLKKQKSKFEDVLMLGLGGGTLAHLISKNFNQPNIVSVDIDEIMVDVARKYFDINSIPNHRVILEDALRFVVEPGEHDIEHHSFDVIIVDILVGEKYPDLGKSGNFVAALKSLLKENGVIIFNRIYTVDYQDDVNLFIEFIETFLSDVDSEVVAGYTNSDNVIIYGRV